MLGDSFQIKLGGRSYRQIGRYLVGLWAVLFGLLTNCSLDNLGLSISEPTYPLGGSVDGLLGSNLRLALFRVKNQGAADSQNEPIEEVVVDGDPVFEFQTEFASGTAYQVQVNGPPQAPVQTCRFEQTGTSSYEATMGSTSAELLLDCTTENYSVGGLVDGLAGSGLTLQLNSEEIVTIGSDGLFSFTSAIEDGDLFNVQVKDQPAGQTCTAYNNTGTLAGRLFSDVVVACSDKEWEVAGFVIGLAGSGLRLSNNGGPPITVTDEGFFRFPSKVADGTQTNVQVVEQPTNPQQTCTPDNVPDVVRGQDKVDVFILCSTVGYELRGTVSDLIGNGLVVQVNGGSDIQIVDSGTFQFAAAQADGSNYQVTVRQQPIDPAQTCYVASSTGTVDGGPVDDIRIECDTRSFSLGGFVSGLTGSGLVLQNSGDQLDVTGNGSYQMDVLPIDGENYNVVVAQQPTSPRQVCEVVNGSGEVDEADVDDVFVNCTNAYLVGGTVTGLLGDGLVIENSLTGSRAVLDQAGPGSYELPEGIALGGNYNLFVANQPDALSQTCTFDAPPTVTRAAINQDYSDVDLSCSTDSFTIAGVVTGLPISSIGLRLTGPAGTSDEIVNSGSGTLPFSFSSLPLLDGSAWAVSVYEPLLGYICAPADATGSGTLAGENVTTVEIGCAEDTGPPEVISITTLTAGGTYNAGAVIEIEINTNKIINVDTAGGTPVLTLNSGGTASYDRGSGSGTLVFVYTIGAGDDAAIFDVASTAALTTGGGTMQTPGGGDLELTLPAPGSGDQLPDAGLVVDAFAAAPVTPVLTAGFDSGVSDSDGITNQSLITFAGTIEPGAELEMLVDGVVVDTTTADGAGDFSHALNLGPLDGGYSITFRQEDIYGNRSLASGPLNLTLDQTVAPPGEPDLDPASDSGTSSTDDITNVPAGMVFSGTGEIGATLELLVNGFAEPTVTVDGGGNWTATGSAATGFTHSIAARQTDLAGNTSALSTLLMVTVDTDPPVLDSVVISATGPSSTVAFIGEDITVDFDSNETVTITDVSILGNSIGAPSGGPTTWSATYTAMGGDTEGPVPFIITTITDLAGNTTASVSATTDGSSVVRSDTPLTIVSAETLDMDYNGRIDHLKLTFDAPVQDLSFDQYGGANSFGSVTTEWIVAGYSNVRIDTRDSLFPTYGAIDDIDNDDVLYLAFDEGGSDDVDDPPPELTTTVSGAVIAASTGAPLAQLVAGSVAETDLARPLAPPVPDLPAVSDSGSSNSDNVTNVTSAVTYSGVADSLTTVELLIDGTPVNSDAADGGGNWSLSYSLSGGDADYDLTLRQTDGSGNTSVESSALTVTIDTSGPSLTPVSIISNNGSDTSLAYTGDTVTVSFTSNETLTSTPTATILGQGAIVTGGGTSWQADYTITDSDMAGAVAFNITGLTDLAGNSGSAVNAVTDGSNVDRATTAAISYDQGGNTTGPFTTGVVIISVTYSSVVASIPNISIDQPGTIDISAVPMTDSGDSTTFTYDYTINADDGANYIDGSATTTLSSVNDLGGNSADVPTGNGFNINTLGFLLISAETMDGDGNGRIDHYRLTFNLPVDDASFSGYMVDALGAAQTDWLVAGYSGVVMAHGTAAPESDTADDEVIYIKFDEVDPGEILKIYDTAIKPDITTTVTPGLNDTSSFFSLAQITTIAVDEADTAAPVLTKAFGLGTGQFVDLAFTEAVDSTVSIGCDDTNTLNDSHFTYTDGNAGSATDLLASGWIDDAGCDGFLRAAVDAAFTAGDISGAGDSVAPAAASIYDVAGNAAAATPVFLIGTGDVWQARYSAAPNWLDRVRLSDTSTACDGTEAGLYNDCLHGGEKRQLEVPGYTSCSGLTATDNLGAFLWQCDDSVSPVRFVSYGLLPHKNLSDLIDWDSCPNTDGATCYWRQVSLQVRKSDIQVYTSRPKYWAANAIEVSDPGAGLVVNLSTAGTIYVLRATQTAIEYKLADSTALVIPEPFYAQSTSSLSTGRAVELGSFTWFEGEARGFEDCIKVMAGEKFAQLRNAVAYECGGDGFDVEGDGHLVYQTRVSEVDDDLAKVSGSYNRFVNFDGSTTLGNGDGIASACTNCIYGGIKIANIDETAFSATGSNTGTIIDGLLVVNSQSGLFFDSGIIQNLIIRNVSAISNFDNNFRVDSNTSGSSAGGYYMENLLSINAKTKGIYFQQLDNGHLHNLVNVNTGDKMEFENVDDTPVSGYVKIGVPNDCTVSSSSNLGLDDKCEPDNGSSFDWTDNVDGSDTIYGKVTSNDSVNPEDSSGLAGFSSINNWLDFENPFRTWGLNGDAFPKDNHTDACNSGTCRIWDYRIDSSDTAARNVNSIPTDSDYFSHTWYTASEPANQTDCDNDIYYDSTFVAGSPNTCQTDILIHVSELYGDGVGNDNFLCEAGETCLYNPNTGYYQGEESDPATNCETETTEIVGTEYCLLDPLAANIATTVSLVRYDSLSEQSWSPPVSLYYLGGPTNWTDIQTELLAQAALGTSGSVTSDTVGSVSGSYHGAVLALNGRVYGIPWDAGSFLAFDPDDDSTATFGSAPGGQAWAGGVLATNGKIYTIPYNSNDLVEIDPDTNGTNTYGTVSGSEKYRGGVLAENEMIYAIPADASSVLKIDPSDNSHSTFGSLGSGNRKWAGGVLAPNGKIYGCPLRDTSILVIDPSDDSVYTFGNVGSGNEFGGGAIGPNGKIYCMPGDSTDVLVIDPSDDSFTVIAGVIGSASNEWYGGVLTPSGLIIGIPWSAPDILVIDPSTDTAYRTGSVSGSYRGGVLAPNGNVYAVPSGAGNILSIDSQSNGEWPQQYYWSNLFNKL